MHGSLDATHSEVTGDNRTVNETVYSKQCFTSLFAGPLEARLYSVRHPGEES